MIRNEVADLTKDREATFRWLLFLAFCFHNRALWHGAEQKPTFFLSKTPLGYGMAVKKFGVAPLGGGTSELTSLSEHEYLAA